MKQRRASHGTPSVSGTSDQKQAPGRGKAAQLKGRRNDSSASSQPSRPATQRHELFGPSIKASAERKFLARAGIKAEHEGEGPTAKGVDSAAAAWGTARSRRGGKGRRSGSVILEPVPEDTKVPVAAVKSEHQADEASQALVPVGPSSARHAAVKAEPPEPEIGAHAAAPSRVSGKRKARPTKAASKKGQPAGASGPPTALRNGADFRHSWFKVAGWLAGRI